MYQSSLVRWNTLGITAKSPNFQPSGNISKQEFSSHVCRGGIKRLFWGPVEVLRDQIDHYSAITTDAVCEMPLLEAARSGHEKMVKLLIDHGANIEARDREPETPLRLVAVYGHGAIVKQFVDRSTGLDCLDNNGRTPLSIAAAYGRRAIVTQHIDRSAGLDCLDKDGGTPLSNAADAEPSWRLESDHPFPHAHTVRVLRNARANPDILDLRI